jgi:[protein-PII] uridylyltransferase
VLSGDRRVEDLLEERQPGTRSPTGVAVPPRVTVDNRLSDSYTVIEVKCPDRVGLLYLITRTLSAAGLDIASARIATEIDKAFDTFYVTDAAGQKVTGELAMSRVREALEDALSKPL